MNEFKELLDLLVRFRDERDWGQFHDSKNLALALSIEASELNELFLWKKEEEAEDCLRPRRRATGGLSPKTKARRGLPGTSFE